VSELSDDEVKILQAPEDEGVLSKDVAARVRTALRVANVAGKIRTRIAIGLACLFVATLLGSAGYFFSGLVGWACFLCSANAILVGVVGIVTLMTLEGIQ